ncbi:MAG: hypothetical protein KF681_03015 [Bdellovibrionaceae bacterium]|nr:hypothetical protein [Pseudobdellovibrionaceae bacterium]
MRKLACMLILLLAPFAARAQMASCASVYSRLDSQRWLDLRLESVRQTRTQDIRKTTILTPSAVVVSAPTRNALLQDVIYQRNIVEASEYSRLMSDKLFQVKYLTRVAPQTAGYFPKTMGLREFLRQHHLLSANGQLQPNSAAAIVKTFERAFPSGAVVKPVAGYNTGGKGFFINESAALAQELVSMPQKFLGSSRSFLFASPELGLASGEGWIVQELLRARVQGRPVDGKPPEYRVHTFEGKVVSSATESRWLVAGEKNFPEVDAYVQKFLNLIPAAHLKRQAWGLDVVQLGPNDFRIIEINTNRGQPIQWSGYLLSSLQLGAHVRHWEQVGAFKLEGPFADVFRRNRANLESWVRKEGRDTVLEDLRINDPLLAREVENEI